MKSLLSVLALVGTMTLSIAAAAHECTTTSNGQTFWGSGMSDFEAGQQAYRACVAGWGTNSNECQSRLVCRGGGGGGGGGGGYEMVTCTAYSNGFEYSYSDYDQYRATAAAVNACKNDRRTNYWECDRQVYCSNGGGGGSRQVTCTTSSYGRQFVEYGWDMRNAQRRVLMVCAQQGDRRECMRNLYCY